jgi:hypothetical protein
MSFNTDWSTVTGPENEGILCNTGKLFTVNKIYHPRRLVSSGSVSVVFLPVSTHHSFLIPSIL